MEQNKINLQAIEEETNAKIAAVNNKKVAIMGEYLGHMQVCLCAPKLDFYPQLFCILWLTHMVFVDEGQTEYGQGVLGSSERRSLCWENQTGDRLQGQFSWTQASRGETVCYVWNVIHNAFFFCNRSYFWVNKYM